MEKEPYLKEIKFTKDNLKIMLRMVSVGFSNVFKAKKNWFISVDGKIINFMEEENLTIMTGDISMDTLFMVSKQVLENFSTNLGKK